MTAWKQIGNKQSERLARWLRSAPLWTQQDDAVRAAVLEAGGDLDGVCGSLLEYFWRGQSHYRDRRGTLADYPGWPSCYGARSDAVEGVTRLLPLWSAALLSHRCPERLRIEIGEGLRQSLTNGCDPAHPGYWGDVGPRSTLICEAADVALAVWLARETVWTQLEESSRQNILRWLSSVVELPTADNNWHLFVALVDAVCVAFGARSQFSSAPRMTRIWSFAQSDGCFRDGPDGQVDLYNAWGFHYLLFWLRRIAPSADDERGRSQLQDYVRWYRWLITPEGIPLWGRSLCYRLATPVPLQLASLDGLGDSREASAAMLAVWRFFVANGALRAGRPTQGVFGEDMRWLDPYSGPASSFWGTRSLLLQLLMPASPDPSPVLPAASADVEMRIAGLGASLSARGGRTALTFDGPDVFDGLKPWTLRQRLRAGLYAVATRPANNLLRLGWRQFDSQLQMYR